MQAVILAAGFGERLKPYTEKLPKALLDVGSKPVIDHLLEFLSGSPEITTYHIRTNALYYPVFKEWLRQSEFTGKVELSNNGVESSAERFGAVGDLEDICSKKQIGYDLLVVAGDNIFDFSISPFVEFCAGCDGDVVAVMDSSDRAALKAGAFVDVTSDGRIIDFTEKPRGRTSALLALPLYRLSAETIPFLKKYIMDGQDRDNIGSFFAWSYRRRPLFAFRTEGARYHISCPASYKRVCSIFEKNRR